MSLILNYWSEMAASLVSPQGTLTFNGATGQRYVLDNDGCKVSRPLRVTKDNIPQQNGSIAHRRFTEGYQITLKVNLLVDDDPACDADAVAMTDALMLHLNAMLEVESGRFYFTPPGAAERIFDACQWLTYPEQSTSPYPSATFTLDTPFPYAISSAQTTPALGGTVTNNGNTDFWPVLHIDGPTDGFVVGNNTTGKEIFWGPQTCNPAVTIGSGDWVEIDAFRATITKNGDVRFVDCGLTTVLSQYWSLQPGPNETELIGASGYVLMNDAWA